MAELGPTRPALRGERHQDVVGECQPLLSDAVQVDEKDHDRDRQAQPDQNRERSRHGLKPKFASTSAAVTPDLQGGSGVVAGP